MPRTNPSNGQNLRLAVVFLLAALAVGSTLFASSADTTALDETTTTTNPLEADDPSPTTTSAPDATSTTTSSAPDRDGVDVVVVGGDGDGPGTFVIDTDGFDAVDDPEGVDEAATEAALAVDDAIDACSVGIDSDADLMTAEGDDDAAHVENFSAGADAWNALAGRWEVVDGAYHQTDASGFDLISQLRVDPPESYRVTVTVQVVDDGGLGGGFILGQPIPADRSGATVVDFTDGGSFLRWGRYDPDTAQYVYGGGVAMPAGFDPSASHELAVEVRPERTLVLVDGVEVGMFDPIPFGRLGLVTSKSTVAFDDLRIVEVGA